MKEPTTVEEANAFIQEPIRSSKSDRGTMHYTSGRSAKKWNPLYYETISGHGFKRWKKNLTKDAPRTTTARVRLYGEGANDAAMKLQEAGVDGSCIEFPTCPECGDNVRLYHDYDMCRGCFDKGLEAYRAERKDAPPEWEKGGYNAGYGEWKRQTRQDYRDRLLDGAPTERSTTDE